MTFHCPNETGAGAGRPHVPQSIQIALLRRHRFAWTWRCAPLPIAAIGIRGVRVQSACCIVAREFQHDVEYFSSYTIRVFEACAR